MEGRFDRSMSRLDCGLAAMDAKLDRLHAKVDELLGVLLMLSEGYRRLGDDLHALRVDVRGIRELLQRERLLSAPANPLS